MDAAMIKVAAYIAAGFAMGVGTIGPAIGQGRIGGTAIEMIGKYPENYGPLRTTMLLAMAFVETAAIYALVVALVLIFLG